MGRQWAMAVIWILAGCDTLPRLGPPDAALPAETGGPGDIGDAGRTETVDPGGRDLAAEAEVPSDPSGGCERQCYGKACGPDGCGGVCGTCPPETSCSHDGAMCILQAIQAPLGGGCGPTIQCGPTWNTPWTWGMGLPNPDYPACLDDQCREGPCLLGGACSRQCRTTRDLVQNGTNLPVPDGIDDADAPAGDCGGAMDGVFPGGDWVCVETESTTAGGRCLPRASFTPCHDGTPCPRGESCGFLKVRGNLEARCLAVPVTGQGIGASCGWDAVSGTARWCQSWACSSDGCTAPCLSDDACQTEGAWCQDGICQGSLRPCESHRDCSAWTCRTGVSVQGLPGTYVGCAPRLCDRDEDCRDPGYYCLHDGDRILQGLPGDPIGRCVRRQQGGATLGEFCDMKAGDGLPDRPCANRAYCLQGRCSALCRSDEDCGAGGRCVVREVPTKTAYGTEVPLPVPLCVVLGESGGALCASDRDCPGGACAPYLELERPMELTWRCRETLEGDAPIGAACGSNGPLCASELCLDEDPDNRVPGQCSGACTSREDCPAEGTWGVRRIRFLCGSRSLHRMGSWYAGDDLWASVCLAVPAESSLTPCDFALASCPDFREFCRPVAVFGPPSRQERLEGLCVRLDEGGAAPGMPCDPGKAGRDCATGLCEPSIYRGAGFCTHACLQDTDCAGLAAWGATCALRPLFPGAGADRSVSLCRQAVPCVACSRDEDCTSGLRCLDVSSSPYEQDLRCVPACQEDRECADYGEGVTCQEARAPLISSLAGREKGCLPWPCP